MVSISLKIILQCPAKQMSCKLLSSLWHGSSKTSFDCLSIQDTLLWLYCLGNRWHLITHNVQCNNQHVLNKKNQEPLVFECKIILFSMFLSLTSNNVDKMHCIKENRHVNGITVVWSSVKRIEMNWFATEHERKKS